MASLQKGPVTGFWGKDAVEQPAEPAGWFRHGLCERRKARASPSRGLAVRSADRISGRHHDDDRS